MRLLKLSMSNIGPYRGLTTIDFTELAEVFLVCGTTGSGKSTIFEAIAYALYGAAIGKRDLVSHYARADQEVFVDLEFMVGRERWRVWRKPARTLPKKRGDGTTDKPPEVALWLQKPSGWDQRGDKQTEVEESISRIIGLSADEFTKIVLLPQGEFQRFLEMKTGDRTQILEKLFPVSLHGAVSDLAKAKAKEAESRAKDMDASIDSMVAELGTEPEKGLAADREALVVAQTEEAEAFKARDAARAQLQTAESGAKAWAEYDGALSEAQDLKTGAPEAASLNSRLLRAEAAMEAAPAIEAARRARAAVSESEAARLMALEAIQASDERRASIEVAETRVSALAGSLAALDREEGLLSGRLAAWNRLSQARERLALIDARWKTALQETDAARTSLQAARATLLALESGAADTDALSLERAAASANKEECREAQRFAMEAARFTKETTGLQTRIASVLSSFTAAEERRVTALANLSATEKALEAQGDALAAGRLAHHLVEGLPCPVCGSTEHPAPAKVEALPLATPLSGTESKRTDPTEARKLAQAAVADTGAEAARQAATLEELRRNLADRQASALPYASAPALEAATEALHAAEARLGAADEALAAASARSKEAAQAREETDRLRTLMEDAATRSSALAIERSGAQSSVDEASSSAGAIDPEPLLERVRDARKDEASERAALEADIAAWMKERSEHILLASEAAKRLEAATSSLELANAVALKALEAAGFEDEDAWEAASMSAPELASIRTQAKTRATAEASSSARLDAAQRAIKGVERPDQAAALLAFQSADQAHTKARLALDAATSAERSKALALKALESIKADRAALRIRGDRLVALSRLLNGETEGRHLSFKNFVLASYFGFVVDRASARLREMSDGRYDMSVTEGKSAGRGRVGLDLAVLDSFTGVARPASSLSGGEKFLASISLALGLSEVIVARSGGVSLDSIFIDEGFGSLDDETLDRAMAALERVRGERVIGIVSHVAELRNRIPAHIEVNKTSAGSTLTVVS